MSDNPYASPQTSLAQNDGSASEADIEKVNKAQKLMLRAFGVSLVLRLVSGIVAAEGGAVFAVIMGMAALACLIALLIGVYRVASGLGKNGILYLIGMFVPLLNLIILIMLNNQASNFLRANGLEVGFWGAKY